MDANELMEKLESNYLPVVVDFWAPWCGPCKSIAPALERLSHSYARQVDVWQVNIEEVPELKVKFRITGLPTLVAFRGRQEVTRCTGAASQAVLGWLFEAAISGVPPSHPAFVLRENLVYLFMDLSKGISRLERSFGKNRPKATTADPAHESHA